MGEGDLEKLAFECKLVDAHFGTGQHPTRRWEYAMALRASETRDNGEGTFYDVGGAGSPFRFMLPGIKVIDPKENTYLEDFYSVPASAVFCISVIEHVPDLADFCSHLARVTAPGGLLFLTSDIWGEAEEEEDRAKWWWDRKRIFTPKRWRDLYEDHFAPRGFSLLGEADWEYHGALMRGEDGSAWGYSLAVMALVKEG